MTVKVSRAAYVCLVAAAIFLGVPAFQMPAFAGKTQADRGAVVEKGPRLGLRVNPEAGDFRWELEGKPAPRYKEPLILTREEVFRGLRDRR